MEAHFVSMGRGSTLARFVVERDFVSIINENSFARIVVVFCTVQDPVVWNDCQPEVRRTLLTLLCPFVPDEPAVQNYKTKETTLWHLSWKQSSWIKPGLCDRRTEGGCSRRRPTCSWIWAVMPWLLRLTKTNTMSMTVPARTGGWWRFRRIWTIVTLWWFGQILTYKLIWSRAEFRLHGHTASRVCMSMIKKKWKNAWDARLASLAETIEYWIANRSN